jgi:hypothetical protein
LETEEEEAVSLGRLAGTFCRNLQSQVRWINKALHLLATA